MKLARTAPFKGYTDIQDRTYECPKCGHSESWIATQNVPQSEDGEITYH
jgi:transcription elongation factor Elf1